MGKSRRLALNEAIKKSQDKFGQSSEVVPLRPNDTEKPAPPIIEPEVEKTPGTRKMQLENDKPLHKKGLPKIYPIMVLLIMGVILACFVVFKLTDIYDKRSPQIEDFKFDENQMYHEDLTQPSRDQNSEKTPVSHEKANELLTPLGDHKIVITQYNKRPDLVEVQKYFKKNGIETEIEQRGDVFFLKSKDKYQNPKREGSDGFLALQRIKKVGINYKAPRDFETFGSRPFQDAYGEKIRN